MPEGVSIRIAIGVNFTVLLRVLYDVLSVSVDRGVLESAWLA